MQITRHDTKAALLRLSRLKEHSSFSDRIRAVAHYLGKKPAREIANKLDRSVAWVFKWLNRYNEDGFEGLKDRPRSGQPKKLTPEEEADFRDRVLQGPQPHDEGLSRFTAEHLMTILLAEYGVNFSSAGVYQLLHRLGLSHIKPRPKHPQNDPEKMQEWKEALPLFFKTRKTTTQKKKSKSGSRTNRVLVSKECSQKSGRKKTPGPQLISRTDEHQPIFLEP
jgi:transposase